MKKRLPKYSYLLSIIVIVMSQFGFMGMAFAENSTPKVAGDDPGVTITATNPIYPSGNVQVDVSMASTAGTITEDGVIKVAIPKVIVSNKEYMMNNIVIDDPFYLADPALEEDNEGNYIINIAYDHTKYDPHDAQGNTVKILFKAPYLNSTDPNNNYPDEVEFSSDLYMGNNIISSDKTVSQVSTITPGNPLLSKFAITDGGYEELYGHDSAILDPNNPSRNKFAIIVNYNQQSLDNVQIVDTIPEGTYLTDPDKYIPATGDSTVINHFRIAKVNGRDENGIPNSWEYVTTEFSDKIFLTDSGFTVDFGNLTPNDSYVLMYAQNIDGDFTPDEFGSRLNNAVLTSNGEEIRQSGTYMALKEVQFDSVTLNKEVSQSTLAVNSGDLIYTLTFKNNVGKTTAGTKLTDPLPEFLSFVSTTDNSSGYLSDVEYDSETNSVSYELLKDLPAGESVKVSFKVHFENPDAVPGETIVNKAYFNYSGTNISSKDTTTTLDGSAHLYKIDADNENPLAGAEFKIVDAEGNTVVENLVTDEKGFINSGILSPGNYAFVETKAPNGYVLDESPIPFIVTEGQETAINLTATNKLNVPITGSVTLKKVSSESNKTLAGAEFKLVKEDGTVLDENLITDENGLIHVSDLEPGNYKFIETKAPDGYELDETPITFTIYKDDDTDVKVTKKNTLIPTEPSTTEPSTTEPSTTEPSTTEPSTTEPSTTEPSTTEPSTTEPSTTEPSTTEPSTTEPSTTEPSTTEPSTTEPSTTEPSTTEPSTTESKNDLTTGSSSNKPNGSSDQSSGGSLPKTGDSGSNPIVIIIGLAFIGLAVFSLRKSKKH